MALEHPGGSGLKFANVTCAGKAGHGVFKITAEQLGWECQDKNTPSSISWDIKEISSAAWQRSCGRGFGLLKLHFQGDAGVVRFAGFRNDDQGALTDHLKTYSGVSLEEQPVSTSGWSWGDWEMDADGGEFRVNMEDCVGIEVPTVEVVHVTALGKTDLNLEFQTDCQHNEEMLHEMRLYFPGQGPATASAESVREELLRHSGFSTKGAKGEAITRVSDIAVTAPRGRHDFEFFEQVVKIHGKTQSYTIKYKSIARMFLVTMPTTEIAFVIGLDQPLRQGSQQHAFLLLTFDRERSLPIDIPKEKLAALNLPQLRDQKECEFVPRLFKELSQKGVIAPSSEFLALLKPTAVGTGVIAPCVRCSLKTQVGLLYPLRDSMLFITKPVVWIRHREVEVIEFASTVMRRTSFDLRVHVRTQPVVEFTNVERKVYDALKQYFESRGVKIQVGEEVRKMNSFGSGTSRTSRQRSASAKGASKPDTSFDDSEDDEDYNDEGSNAGEGESGDSSAEPEAMSEDEAPKKKRARK